MALPYLPLYCKHYVALVGLHSIAHQLLSCCPYFQPLGSIMVCTVHTLSRVVRQTDTNTSSGWLKSLPLSLSLPISVVYNKGYSPLQPSTTPNHKLWIIGNGSWRRKHLPSPFCSKLKTSEVLGSPVLFAYWSPVPKARSTWHFSLHPGRNEYPLCSSR